MILGGGGFDMHSPAPALADTRIVDLTDPAPGYQAAAPMDHPRMHLSAVILPDRTVLATGGSAMEEMAHARTESRADLPSGSRNLDAHRRQPRSAAVSLGRAVDTGRQGGHGRLQPGAQDRRAADRDVFAALPVSRSPARR